MYRVCRTEVVGDDREESRFSWKYPAASWSGLVLMARDIHAIGSRKAPAGKAAKRALASLAGTSQLYVDYSPEDILKHQRWDQPPLCSLCITTSTAHVARQLLMLVGIGQFAECWAGGMGVLHTWIFVKSRLDFWKM